MAGADAKPVRSLWVSGVTMHLEGEGAFPQLAGRPHNDVGRPLGLQAEMAVLPGGMDSGRPSAALLVDLGGETIVIQMSWALLAMTVRGFAARYGWPK